MLSVPRPRAQQHLDGPHDPPPYRSPIEVALVEQFICLHGGEYGGFVAVLVDEELGRAVNVEVGGH